MSDFAHCPECGSTWSYKTNDTPTCCPVCGTEGLIPAEGASTSVLAGGYLCDEGASRSDSSREARPAPSPHHLSPLSPLLDFRLRYGRDNHEWWHLSFREAKELFDAALAHIDALQDRIDALPDDPCPTCAAVACCCAYDWPGAICGFHMRNPSPEGSV